MVDQDTDGIDDLRVIGNPGNANQDGMDWIGSSNGLVRNSFFRASDDDIALMGNWDGYTDADLVRPGKEVHDITIEDSQLSTSISNIVRAGWPKKIFNSWNFTLKDSDILHAGIGGCGQTFGLIGFWGANGSRGDHNNYRFENLWLDNWYSLAQMEQQAPSLRNFTFKNIWALDQPPLVGSSMRGSITGAVFDNVKYGQKVAMTNADVPLATDTAQPAKFQADSGAEAAFTVDPPVIAKGAQVTFTAKETPHAKYTWMFGDGTEGARARGASHFHRCGRNGPRRARRRGPLPRDAARGRQPEEGRLGLAGRGGGGALVRACESRGRDGAGARVPHLSRHVDGVAGLHARAAGDRRLGAEPERERAGIHTLRRDVGWIHRHSRRWRIPFT